MLDISKHLYLCIAVVSGYLFIMFLVWWIRVKSATVIFQITCFLMLGLFFNYFGLWWMHFNLAYGTPKEAFIFYRTWWWPYRHLTILIPLIWYAYHISKIAWRERRSLRYFRRMGDL